MSDQGYMEFLALALGMFVLTFIVIRRGQFRVLNGSGWLMVAFGVLFASYILTAIQEVVTSAWLDLAGQFCRTASVWLMTVWTWRYLAKKESVS